VKLLSEVNLGSFFKDNPENIITPDKLMISDLVIDQIVEIDLKLISKRIQTTKDGKNFLILTLNDKTGYIRAIDWYNPINYEASLNIGDVIRLKGKIVNFDSRPQLNISRESDSIKLLSSDMINQEKFLQSSRISVENMKDNLFGIIETINDSELKNLLKTIFSSDEISKFFFAAPAALSVHHAYKHGLIEHTLKVTEIAESICEKYKNTVDRDICITGAILHDIGKIDEYSITPSGIEVSETGELIGHISSGASKVYQYCKKSDISKDKAEKIIHIILSHHGEMEYGSPVIPKTLEAMIVHFSDNLESKIKQAIETIETTKNNNPEAVWSDFDKRLGRRLKINSIIQEDF